MNALAYADKALEGFFEKAMRSSYFKDSLFVLTADHAHSMSLKWEPEDLFQRNKIPLFFYSPGLLIKPNIVNENYGSHMDIPPTIVSIISEKSIKMHSWGRSLVEPPKSKLLLSHDINCLKDVCIANDNILNFKQHLEEKFDKVYLLQKDQKLAQCKTTLCIEKSKHLTKIIKAFWNSGFNYLFNYRTAKSESSFVQSEIARRYPIGGFPFDLNNISNSVRMLF